MPLRYFTTPREQRITKYMSHKFRINRTMQLRPKICKTDKVVPNPLPPPMDAIFIPDPSFQQQSLAIPDAVIWFKAWKSSSTENEEVAFEQQSGRPGIFVPPLLNVDAFSAFWQISVPSDPTYEIYTFKATWLDGTVRLATASVEYVNPP